MEYMHPKVVPCQAVFHSPPFASPDDLFDKIGKRHHPSVSFAGIPNLLDIGLLLWS
jgi:hypothetical protein